jgi:hypothetical protein
LRGFSIESLTCSKQNSIQDEIQVRVRIRLRPIVRLKSALIICTNATRDDKSRLFKIKVIVKAKSIIANKIRKIMLLCGDLKG